MTASTHPSAEEIAHAIGKRVADRCSAFRKNGRPASPNRYAVIWQAAQMGALEALNSPEGETL